MIGATDGENNGGQNNDSNSWSRGGTFIQPTGNEDERKNSSGDVLAEQEVVDEGVERIPKGGSGEKNRPADTSVDTAESQGENMGKVSNNPV
jgi:hypothetical protein